MYFIKHGVLTLLFLHSEESILGIHSRRLKVKSGWTFDTFQVETIKGFCCGMLKLHWIVKIHLQPWNTDILETTSLLHSAVATTRSSQEVCKRVMKFGIYSVNILRVSYVTKTLEQGCLAGAILHAHDQRHSPSTG